MALGTSAVFGFPVLVKARVVMVVWACLLTDPAPSVQMQGFPHPPSTLTAMRGQESRHRSLWYVAHLYCTALCVLCTALRCVLCA